MDSTLWAGTKDGGIFIFSKLKEPEQIKISGSILNICGDSGNSVWICTDGEGLIHCVKKSDGWEIDRKYIPSDTVRGCCKDKNGNVWIASFSGLKKLELPSGKISVRPRPLVYRV